MKKTEAEKFSFFRKPVTSITPVRNITLKDVYTVITRDYYKELTRLLRQISDPKQAREFKAANFDFVTFSGTFSKRNEQSLLTRSGYMVIDFDHLSDVHAVKSQLLKDPYFETELLFISPSGNGLKWVITIDISGKYTHGQYFDAVSNYISATHRQEVDKSGRDISRLCFLSWDPEAYIHPKYLL